MYIEENDEIIAYLRILPPGVSYEELSIGRVLVKKEHRGKKLGQQLMAFALQFIQNELKEITAFPNGKALAFRLGMKVRSDEWNILMLQISDFFYNFSCS